MTSNVNPVLLCCVLISLLIGACQSDVPEVSGLPDEIDFNFHIRPILSNNCFNCHGPDPSSRASDMRLDEQEFAEAMLESGIRPIVPGNSSKSAIIHRVTAEDSEMRMPPPDANKQLTPREVALLAKWIDQGAKWKPYWAFIKPDPSDFTDLSQHVPEAIDQLLNKEIEQKGLVVSPGADRYQLIRRVAYIVTGLPPTSEETEMFVADQDNDWYAKMVDHYLESPHYGERWARHWMDLARYAEGRGHEFDFPVVGAWRYRDYLIRAFNQDVPYDDFIREQIAGDLVDPPRINPETGFVESPLGTTFLALGEGKHSPVDIKEEEKILVDNIIDVTTKTFQGLTVACARCHDHKFDPIPTADYYALYGIFESMRYHHIPAETRPGDLVVPDSLKALKRTLRKLLAEEATINMDDIALATPVSSSNTQVGEGYYSVMANFMDEKPDDWRADGFAFDAEGTLGNPVIVGDEVKLIEEGTVSSTSISKGLQGTYRSPTFIIKDDFVRVRARGKRSTIRLVVENFQLIRYPIWGDLEKKVDDEVFRDYDMNTEMLKGSKAYVEFLSGDFVRVHGKGHFYDIPSESWMEASYVLSHNGDLDSVTLNNSSKAPRPVQPALNAWVEGNASSEEVKMLNRQVEFEVGEEVKRVQQHIARLSDGLRDSTFVVGVVDGDPLLSPVFKRGDHHMKDSIAVPHRFFSAIPDLSTFDPDVNTRLQLANAMASKDNPLTARVMANRIWHHLFGRGIVKSVDNFGLQGNLPSHPALLDYLAIQLVEGGWSVKNLIRQIVMTDAFRRSTIPEAEEDQRDPENIFLAHYPIRRLEAESIRDGILAVAGELDPTLYGPSIPIHLTSFLQGRGRPPESGPLDGRGRRSIYIALWRNFLPPMMLTFDMPVPFSSFGNRNVTNVPAQSLTLLNDPFVQEQAEKWAEKILVGDTSDEEKVDQIYLKAFNRKPTEVEREEGLVFIREQRAIYASDTDVEEKSWTDYCHAVFNMKEFIYLL